MKELFFKTSYDADDRGHFGAYGGRYVPEMLMPALEELEKAYDDARRDPGFARDLTDLYHHFSGRPTPLYHAQNLSRQLGGAQIFIKNEGLNHTGAHKINHCLGQALLAQRMGKKRIIAETGAGQHGLATATVAARFGFECTVFMGEVDVARQRPNVFWMEQLGTEVRPVGFGSRTLKDAVNAALKDWIATVETTHYIIGSCLGPHPYPSMNRDFQAIVGAEVEDQIQDHGFPKPDYVIACVGGGSNSLGIFNAFLDDPEVHLIGVEAGGKGVEKLGDHAARFEGGRPGVVEGYKSFFLQDTDGQLTHTHSISAGLDYAGVGPQIVYLKDRGRLHLTYATDEQAIAAFRMLASTEGILPALESSHAVAEAIKLAPTLPQKKSIVVNLSGRGDKDIFIVAEAVKDSKWLDFLQSVIDREKQSDTK
ncbi:tryptophan synthase subunit beta [Candidatus Wirthbacteria bacterium CG2_30_54_11]|uniref:Tryptophan synthase beta chain n=1 Tax=Candidatus Wirthbacteria bacterium CG2_30_54_11 TaxID=1817892 RepID=A0A1J5IKJ4_9BACT|nr:MAG: tryptophan synthase subunit beta [Candidatus Wirthbacteria bacterium CG2_30_54_11]